MQPNKNTNAYKIGAAIGKVIAHLLFIGIVWLITYGYLTLTSYVFCFGVSLRSSTAACSLILIIYYASNFINRKRVKK